eukprot:CAMPEP_0168568556 /NCGR_PEP_ID=MMETSP0413-20121227/15644_1 /TAXON_ID=136452 /ORGANISM="Filamoeba nolandi, Strain NC-AS-23-1" /LENGTH=212 /DNA_ID=CAMNT_0008600907 /DNA_START=99 /DNA_END=734 /DNA_ORIENTATION=-
MKKIFWNPKLQWNKKIRNIPTLAGASRMREIEAAKQDIDDAEQSLRSMNLSARNIPNNVQLLKKCREYENEIQNMKSNLRKSEAKVNVETDRDDLFSGYTYSDNVINSSSDQRERLISGTDRLNKTSTVLKDAMRTAEETVQVGQDTMTRLDEQTSIMYRMKERLGSINDNILQAKGLLRTMQRRVATNKLILAVIILVLLGAIGLIVWYKW